MKTAPKLIGRKRLIALAAIAFTSISSSHAAPGDLDLSFDAGSGTAGRVDSFALQPDGKIIICGEFTTVRGLPRSGIARLNADGSGDATFDAGAGIGGEDSAVIAVALQPDGKLVIGGNFNSVAGVLRSGIARLNSDGSLDRSFDPGRGINGYVLAVALQPDGKLLLGGAFSSFDGIARNGIARLNSDGTLDTSFTPASYDGVTTIALQPDGMVLIAGHPFGVVRLDPSGTRDAGFYWGSTDSSILSLALQPDGKVIVGGRFRRIHDVSRDGIARLNSDGSVDVGFYPYISSDEDDCDEDEWSYVSAVATQVDGKVLMAGGFLCVNSGDRLGMARLNADGTLDRNFIPDAALALDETWVTSIGLQPNGTVIISGDSGMVRGVSAGIARLGRDGSVDWNFETQDAVGGGVNFLARQGDGRILVIGGFNWVQGYPRSGIARLDGDGRVDRGFYSAVEDWNDDEFIWSSPSVLVLQADGKVLIGGRFSRVNYVPRGGIARLNSDGTLDFGFDPGSGANGQVHSIVLQADGKVLVGGSFSHFADVTRAGIARLNSDGTLDTTFEPGTGGNSVIRKVAMQPDGKVLIGGSFTVLNGAQRRCVARLNEDGSLDGSFDATSGLGGTDAASVSEIVVQPDGKILVAGFFSTGRGANRTSIARLNSDGSLDKGFLVDRRVQQPEYDYYWFRSPLVLQLDGKLLVGGVFRAVINGVIRNGIARLNNDGTLDTSFNTGTGTDGLVIAIVEQSDGKLMIGGWFNRANGHARWYIARLHGDDPRMIEVPRSTSFAAGGTIQLSVRAEGTEPLCYRWFFAGRPLDAFAPTLVIQNAQPAHAGLYSVVVTNAAGTSTAAVRVRVLLPPRILVSPTSKTARANRLVRFNARVSGSAPLQYQWLHDGKPVPGANRRWLTLRKIQSGQSGSYSLVVSNAVGSVTTSPASLVVY